MQRQLLLLLGYLGAFVQLRRKGCASIQKANLRHRFGDSSGTIPASYMRAKVLYGWPLKL